MKPVLKRVHNKINVTARLKCSCNKAIGSSKKYSSYVTDRGVICKAWYENMSHTSSQLISCYTSVSLPSQSRLQTLIRIVIYVQNWLILDTLKQYNNKNNNKVVLCEMYSYSSIHNDTVHLCHRSSEMVGSLKIILFINVITHL